VDFFVRKQFWSVWHSNKKCGFQWNFPFDYDTKPVHRRRHCFSQLADLGRIEKQQMLTMIDLVNHNASSIKAHNASNNMSAVSTSQSYTWMCRQSRPRAGIWIRRFVIGQGRATCTDVVTCSLMPVLSPFVAVVTIELLALNAPLAKSCFTEQENSRVLRENRLPSDRKTDKRFPIRHRDTLRRFC